MAHVGQIYRLAYRRDANVQVFTNQRRGFAHSYLFFPGANLGIIPTYLRAHPTTIVQTDPFTRQPPLWRATVSIPSVGSVQIDMELQFPYLTISNMGFVRVHRTGNDSIVFYPIRPSGHFLWGEIGNNWQKGPAYDAGLFNLDVAPSPGDLVAVEWPP